MGETVLFCSVLSFSFLWHGSAEVDYFVLLKVMGALGILNKGARKSKDKGRKGLSCRQRRCLLLLWLWPLTWRAYLSRLSISSVLSGFSEASHKRRSTRTPIGGSNLLRQRRI